MRSEIEVQAAVTARTASVFCAAKAGFRHAAAAPRRNLHRASGSKVGSQSLPCRKISPNTSGVSMVTVERALVKFARAFGENSRSRSRQHLAAAPKKLEFSGHAGEAAQTIAESSCGLCRCKLRTDTSSNMGNRPRFVDACSFVYAHKMFAMFCGSSSHRLWMTKASMLEKSLWCIKPAVAKAHTVFESSCTLKLGNLPESQAARATAWNRGGLAHRVFAKAQRAFDISCDLRSSTYMQSSLAMLLKSITLRCLNVANAHAIVDKHCTLN